MTAPRIVVVGGGAGGVELATKLGEKFGRKDRAQVTLVDRSRTHLWKPLLHEVAAGSMRQVAQIALLAYCGSFVPAKSACLGPLDRIFTRIGASDDLAGGRSTFMQRFDEIWDLSEPAVSATTLGL